MGSADDWSADDASGRWDGCSFRSTIITPQRHVQHRGQLHARQGSTSHRTDMLAGGKCPELIQDVCVPINPDDLSRYAVCEIGGQKDDQRGHLLRCDKCVHRRLPENLLEKAVFCRAVILSSLAKASPKGRAIHGARTYRVDANSRWAKFSGQRLSEPHYTPFRSSVWTASSITKSPSNRGHIEDCSPACCFQQGNRKAGTMELTLQVDGKHASELGLAGLLYWSCLTSDSGIVDQHVQTRLGYALKKASDRTGIGDVSDPRAKVASKFRGQRLN
ncbi:MAG: hypothetical protein QOC65_1482 [Sphingomonadales bacterium]|nr:hypothetical protein [Sphingomonadales bacterium]